LQKEYALDYVRPLDMATQAELLAACETFGYPVTIVSAPQRSHVKFPAMAE